MKNDTKERIMKVAAALFRKKGFSSTPINDIAREASVSKGALYHYFPAKQLILFEVVSRGMNLTIPYVRKLFSSDLQPKEKLRLITKQHIINLLENLDYVAVGLRDRDKLEEPYWSNYTKLRDEHQFIFEEVIRIGIDQRIFPPVNVKLTTYAILDICNGPARWYNPQGPLKPEQIAKEYSNLICDYMLRTLL